jgi:TolB-like protein
MTLDQALRDAALRIDERIAAGTKIAPLNFNSPHDKFSGYVLDELTANLVDSGKLTVVDRKEIDLIRGEFDFQFSGEVGDDSMQALGRMLGAQSIISGSLTDMGGFYRIVIRVLNVQNASVEVQHRANIVSDSIMAALLTGGKSAAPQGVQAAQTPPAQAAIPVQATAPAPQPAAPAAPPPAPEPPTVYKIGDTGPGGGKIFYVSEGGFTLTADGTTCHYLEAAPVNQGNLRWATSRYEGTQMGTEEAIGTGKSNTEVILATDISAPAAEACKDYRGGGKGDWFLPSLAELAQLHKNRRVVDGLGASNYWSSTQGYYAYSYSYAWFLNFSNGDQSEGHKDNTYTVRAVRAF